jgi:hypothetical protein
MAKTYKGHIQRLPSGSFRVKVYAGTDPRFGSGWNPSGHRQPGSADQIGLQVPMITGNVAGSLFAPPMPGAASGRKARGRGRRNDPAGW